MLRTWALLEAPLTSPGVLGGLAGRAGRGRVDVLRHGGRGGGGGGGRPVAFEAMRFLSALTEPTSRKAKADETDEEREALGREKLVGAAAFGRKGWHGNLMLQLAGLLASLLFSRWLGRACSIVSSPLASLVAERTKTFAQQGKEVVRRSKRIDASKILYLHGNVQFVRRRSNGSSIS